MKTKYISIFLCVVLLIFGCSLFFSKKNGDTSTVKLGSNFKVDNTDARRTLVSNIDTLAASGLYYAAWGMGDVEPYENSDGETVKLYDAQIYLLLGEYESSDSAAANMQTWLSAGRTSYDVLREDEILFCGQTCTRLIYRFVGEDSPHTNGVSIFGIFGDSAVCIELTCRERFAGDPEATMNEFLEACTYSAD